MKVIGQIIYYVSLIGCIAFPLYVKDELSERNIVLPHSFGTIATILYVALVLIVFCYINRDNYVKERKNNTIAWRDKGLNDWKD